ncbi:sporulation protein Cse60 [Lederbergia citri]|uniref:Sporulation protein Cse60 n=1 Tax=Lederbergia citri TaxID=2833580 RepID=A0A942TDU4_9BACI|nr:sporulation protein Cse60 [Lederbergia citri]MBS4194667.1 sporulation protein Cse60 [Lederbergia citri]
MFTTQVKLIEGDSLDTFEIDLKRFVIEIDPDNLIDIKYEVSKFFNTSNERSYASEVHYSALVIYKA